MLVFLQIPKNIYKYNKCTYPKGKALIPNFLGLNEEPSTINSQDKPKFCPKKKKIANVGFVKRLDIIVTNAQIQKAIKPKQKPLKK
jgi:hypothetical protein